ncbi:efflux RND transporter permease subunit [Chitinophaga nivalis]|uniref:Efflux RND transporter permease subunit n=1 Tax=Chitinophaga nivalis TaxID=2991709 RepID=A0ABT3IPN4_9BACT|nr:efflux RND transporter permease subunit [Chitinophaga nivalis]MCW3464377.1 efflux RND transporter permease subunit [Chitinophaga nivalis]MCW3485932.1 efflux RND transporter permease subunit [Chitinophaga nivalis]
MFRKFIERPVLATVISIILVLLGILALVTLPMSQFPEIAPPSVAVTASYPGANAEVVARSVATPIEEAVNGVENMTYMTSTSNNDGSMTLNIYFKLGTNPDLAAVNVQNRVAKATSLLPAEVVQAGISTQKQQNSMIMVVNLMSDKEEYNETFLQNYAKINIIPEIQRVNGVGQAMVFGAKDYSMRIWLKPERLTAYNMSPQEVLGAIRDQNLEAAPGRFGEGSKESFEYIIKYKGKLNKNQQYEDIILRADANGSVVRLKDVARVEFGSFSYGSDTRVNGKYGIGIAINQTSGSNANEIQETINALMKKASAAFPAGVEYFNIYSTKEYLDESIDQVKHTLIEAFILVFIVVFIFLQDFRSTLIPAIAVPVAIIGTFFFMKLFGFSINLLTLFALILAIGIVVDDAIVVVEAVHSKMEKGANPRHATLSSMQEISGAIISITLVMSAVFIPVGFMEGPAGVFYRQFAFTLAIAILISALNALTLSPALCALLLKNNHSTDHDQHHTQKGKVQLQTKGFGKRFFAAFNTGFTAMTNKYVRSLQFLIKNKWVTVTGLLIIGAVTFWLMRKTPSGFIPTEDQGFAVYAVTMPPGSSLERTREVVNKVEHIVKDLEGTHNYLSVSGFNFLSNSSSATSGVGFIKLKPHAQRGAIKNMDAIMGMLQQKFAAIPEASIFVFNMPTVPGFSNVAGFEVILQDRTGGPLDKLGNTAYGFIGELMKRKEIAFAFTTFNNNHPQYEIEIDDRKAKQLGIPVGDILQTMQVYYGSMFASDFNRFGKYYRVIVQADAELRKEVSSLDGVYVKNVHGEMVPINTVVSLKRVYGPETVTRNNLFNAVTINGQAKPGYSSGDAIKAVEEVAAQYLPRGFSYEWVGMTKEEISAGNQAAIIFTLCLIFVYFLLAAQYESYILPLAVILSIPLGIFGVFVFINLFGIDNNIYVQVGLIMLIGLLAKNAILIVEYAVQRRRSGMGLVASAIRAASLRLRPILMTSFAFIAGLLPLMRATGSSAQGNRSISTGAAGGMLTGVILGVFVIPVLYVMFQYLQEKISRKPVVAAAEEGEMVH